MLVTIPCAAPWDTNRGPHSTERDGAHVPAGDQAAVSEQGSFGLGFEDEGGSLCGGEEVAFRGPVQQAGNCISSAQDPPWGQVFSPIA